MHIHYTLTNHITVEPRRALVWKLIFVYANPPLFQLTVLTLRNAPSSSHQTHSNTSSSYQRQRTTRATQRRHVRQRDCGFGHHHLRLPSRLCFIRVVDGSLNASRSYGGESGESNVLEKQAEARYWQALRGRQEQDGTMCWSKDREEWRRENIIITQIVESACIDF